MELGKKLAFMDAPTVTDESVPRGNVLFISQRRYTEVVAIRSSDRGITGTIERIPEPEEEWRRRCGIIRNAGVM